MIKYQRILLLLSIIFAIITSLVGYNFLESKISQAQKKSMLPVPIAIKGISAMSTIKSADLQYVEMPIEVVEKLSIITNENELVGKTTLSPIEKNSPFTTIDLVPDDSSAPFQLPDGHRAITIESSPLISVGGYLKAGMFVDVAWTYQNDQADDASQTKLAFQNIKVLAIGAPTLSENISSSSETITLMMELTDAQKLTLMSATGSIKLMLRPSPTEDTKSLPPMNINQILQ